MNAFESDWISLSQSFMQNHWIQLGRIQDGRIQGGCHHQVELEWMSLSQIEIVWVRVLCKMGESNMAQFKMAAIIKLCENEWVWVRVLCKMAECKIADLKMAEFNMAAIIKMSQNK